MYTRTEFLPALLLALGLAATPTMAATIGPVVNPANGHSYYVIADSPMTWASAESEAITLGGHLVTINDADESTWILNTLSLGTGTYWIGLRDDAIEGNFEWASGEAVTYTQWTPGEPDNDGGTGGGDFVYLSGVTGNWADTDGFFVGFVTGALAEVPASTVPAPPAVWLFGSALGLLGVVRRRISSYRFTAG